MEDHTCLELGNEFCLGISLAEAERHVRRNAVGSAAGFVMLVRLC